MDQKLIHDDAISYGSTDSMEDLPSLNIDSIQKKFDASARNIETVNNNCRFLERASNTIGTLRDNEQLRNKIHNTLFASKKLIDETNVQLMLLVHASLKKGIEYKLRVEKLKSAFEDAVQAYSKLQHQLLVKLRRNLPTEPYPISRSEHKKNEDLSFDDMEQVMASPFEETQENMETIIEREDAIHKIENDITDVHDIMRELSTLIIAQGNAIDSIENAVENAYSDVESGRQELLKATEYANRRTKNILCLLAMVFVIVCIMAIMLYFTLKHD